MSELHSSKEGLKGRVEEELKKREKLYFGFIPANEFTHSLFLVTISLSMVFCCTCYKYYKMRSKKRVGIKVEGEEISPTKSVKKNIKINQMSRITMRKKE